MKACIDWVAEDGFQHIAASAIIVFVLGWLRPVWIAPLVAICIGLAKEAYDRISGKGCASWHDVICDLIGVALGFLWVLLYIIAWRA